MGKIKFLLVLIVFLVGINFVNAQKLQTDNDIEGVFSYQETLKNNIFNIKDKLVNNKTLYSIQTFLFCLIPGIITSTIVFLVYFFKNKMVRKSHSAYNYLIKDSVKITERSKSYNGTHTSKSKKLHS